MSRFPFLPKINSEFGLPDGFLSMLAERESSWNPNAEAEGSTATGMFQFIDDTWRRIAPKYAGISADRPDFMDLRKDPELSARAAAGYATENMPGLREALGRDPTSGELYISHFLGGGGGPQFVKAHGETPDAIAAELFPDAAGSNEAIFYDKTTGKPRTMGEVYGVLTQGFDEGSQMPMNITPQTDILSHIERRLADLHASDAEPDRGERISQMLRDGGIAMVAAASEPGADFWGSLSHGLAGAARGQDRRADERRRDSRVRQSDIDRLMSDLFDFRQGEENRAYRRGRDAIQDERYATERQENRAREERDHQRMLELLGIRTGAAEQKEQRSRDERTLRDYEDRRHEIADSILKSQPEFAENPLTYEDALKEADRVLESGDTGFLEDLHRRTKEYVKTLR